MAKIRVVLRWIQIKDQLDPVIKDHGEFFFKTRVSSGDNTAEHRLPKEGHWEISDHPRFSKVDKLDTVIFEGIPGDSLLVELSGTEVDLFSADDHLDDYRREFSGPTDSWFGRYAPGDEGSQDPENMSNWRICYDIETA